MEYEEYRRYDATGLAELVASGEVSAEELLETAIDRAENVNPRLNAIVRPMYEEGRRRVRERLSGTFAGVPFLIKDLGQDYAGVPISARTTRACQHLLETGFWPPCPRPSIRRS